MRKALEGIIAKRLPGSAKRSSDGFASTFASVTRSVGKAPLVLEAAEATGLQWPLTGWCLDDAVRVVLLLDEADRLPAGQRVELAAETFRQADSRERAAILRALPLLPQPADYVPLAVEGCRTSVQPVFEAIACENPFPERHFPELNFNQLVLKALFIEVPVARILGLERRITPELSRMAADYAAERSAAGRTVPADIAKLTRSPKEL